MEVKMMGEAGYEFAMIGVAMSFKKPVDNMHNVTVKLASKDKGHNKFLEQMVVWLKVRATCQCYALGEVMRPLQLPHDFNVGDLIRVEICHIYNVERKAAWCLNYKS